MNEIEIFFETQIDEHQRIVKRCKDILMDSFSNALEICVKSLKAKNKILFFGNGGSASDAQHLSTELAVRFAKNRKAIPSLSLVTDTSALTAIGNDFGFDQLFSRQIEAVGIENDVAIGITTSGKSKNVLKGLETAKQNGLKTIAFAGKYTDDLEKLCSQIISIPASNTSRIQEMHIMLGQMLCNAIEYKLGLSPLIKEEE